MYETKYIYCRHLNQVQELKEYTGCVATSKLSTPLFGALLSMVHITGQTSVDYPSFLPHYSIPLFIEQGRIIVSALSILLHYARSKL